MIMDKNNEIQLFEDKLIRTAWDKEKEEWYFSVADVVSILLTSRHSVQLRNIGAL